MSDPRRETVQPPIDFGSAGRPDRGGGDPGPDGRGRAGRGPDGDAPMEAPAGEERPQRRLDPPTRRALLLLGAIAAIGIVQIGFLLFVEADRALRHRTAIAQLESELHDLQREADGLRAVAERADDATFREQLARRQGFLYPNETRVVVLEPAPDR